MNANRVRKSQTLTHRYSLFLFVFLFSNWLSAQSISGVAKVCPHNTYTYAVTVPTNWSNVVVTWITTFSGIGVFGVHTTSNNGAITNGFATFYWDGASGPSTSNEIRCKIKYDETTTNTNGNSTTVTNLETTIKLAIDLKGFRSTTFSSPEREVPYCCSTDITYTLINTGDADQFDWTNNTGFILIAGGGIADNSITLRPDPTSGGKLKCRLTLKCSPSTYYQDVEIDIVRKNSAVNLTASPSGTPNERNGINKFSGICAKKQYTYSVPTVCGATSYTWSFPPSWQVNVSQTPGMPPRPHQFWISGQNTNIVTIKTANAPVSGQISVTANFNGCNGVTSMVLPAFVLNSAPDPISFINDANEIYHCGSWKICPSAGGQIPVSNPSGDQIESYTWTITAPWYFATAQGKSQQITTSINQTQFTTANSPSIKRTVGYSGVTGQLSVFATNCIGNSTTTSITIEEEEPAWCPDIPYWQQYPVGCECCEPATGGNTWPMKTEPAAASFSVYPNPTNGILTVELPETSWAILTLFDVAGRIVLKQAFETGSLQLDVQTIAAGTYLLEVVQDQNSYKEHIVISQRN